MLTLHRNFDGFLPALNAQGGAIGFATQGMCAFDRSPVKAGTLTTL